MENPSLNPSANAIRSAPEKWRTLLNQFEDVLAASIFIVDANGNVIVPLSQSGENGSFGAVFLEKTFGLGFSENKNIVLENFDKGEIYLQMIDPFEMHVFAVPIAFENDKVELYLIVGPVVVNKPWFDSKYLALAEQLGLGGQDFLKDIHLVAQVSKSALDAILDLLAEVVKDVLEVQFEKQKFQFMQSASSVVRPTIIDAAEDIFVTIQQDQLLVSILDNAIKMANAEGGSIMLLDEPSQEFVIRVSRGLENKKNIMQSRVKIGEGIAGLAAKGKTPLFIKGTESDATLRPLLKRPEIKHSIIIPLVVQQKVVGVLNLCTKNEESNPVLEHVARDVRQLSRFIATALQIL